MSRIDVPESQRQDFYLYVDEFQNFATESFANILSEARKYRLNLIIAHQYVEQLDETVRAAVFGNVGTLMCFRVGAADAEFLVKEFAPYFDEEDLVNLTKFEVYIKLMIDGVASNPFSAITLPPLSFKKENNEAKIKSVSRERYSKSREIVEDKIARWSGLRLEEDLPSRVQGQETGSRSEDEKGERKKPKKEFRREEGVKKREFKKDRNKFSATCYECGAPVEINFKPDGIRPVYCKKCFQEIREELIHGKERPTKKEPVIEEKTPQPEPEISLNEALKKEPVPINIKRKSKITETKTENNETTNTKSLQPGEVAKL
jgi:CxxC-x17-CxxC domain-containing protein